MNGNNKINLPENLEIKYSRYNIDPVGRVFFKDKRVFRGINKEYAQLYRRIFKSGLIKELSEKNLIPNTKISSYSFDDYGLVLEHKKVLATCPSEWSFSMVKDALISLLKINEICNRYGFQLKDGHLWNLSFDKNHPVFLDLGSIIYYDDRIRDFFKSEVALTMIALILWSVNEDYFARKIIENGVTFYKRTLPEASIWNSEMVKSSLNRFFCSIFPDRKKGEGGGIKDIILSHINKDFIQNKILKSESIFTEWEEYQTDFFDEIRKNKINNRFKRFNNILRLIKTYSSDASSILDLAGNMGGPLYYIEKNTNQFNTLINTDYDENAIEKSYKLFKNLKTKVESYVLNFMLPTRDEVVNIFKSDVVLALAVTHHLVLRQNYNLSFILETIKSYSNKYVYIEFMPLGLYGGSEETPLIPNWYNRNWFRNNFIKKFKLIHEEQLEKNRIIFVGRIK